MPPSVAHETSRASSKRRSYSLLEAQQQYPMQQHGIAVRQSYVSTAPVSLQGLRQAHTLFPSILAIRWDSLHGHFLNSPTSYCMYIHTYTLLSLPVVRACDFVAVALQHIITKLYSTIALLSYVHLPATTGRTV